MAIFIDNFTLEIMLSIFLGIFTSTHADTKFCGCSSSLQRVQSIPHTCTLLIHRYRTKEYGG